MVDRAPVKTQPKAAELRDTASIEAVARMAFGDKADGLLANPSAREFLERIYRAKDKASEQSALKEGLKGPGFFKQLGQVFSFRNVSDTVVSSLTTGLTIGVVSAALKAAGIPVPMLGVQVNPAQKTALEAEGINADKVQRAMNSSTPTEAAVRAGGITALFSGAVRLGMGVMKAAGSIVGLGGPSDDEKKQMKIMADRLLQAKEAQKHGATQQANAGNEITTPRTPVAASNNNGRTQQLGAHT